MNAIFDFILFLIFLILIYIYFFGPIHIYIFLANSPEQRNIFFGGFTSQLIHQRAVVAIEIRVKLSKRANVSYLSRVIVLFQTSNMNFHTKNLNNNNFKIWLITNTAKENYIHIKFFGGHFCLLKKLIHQSLLLPQKRNTDPNLEKGCYRKISIFVQKEQNLYIYMYYFSHIY